MTATEGLIFPIGDGIEMLVINMAFQRGMPENLTGDCIQFEPGDRERAVEEDSEYFNESLGDLANLAQEWLSNNVAPDGYQFVCTTTGVYLSKRKVPNSIQGYQRDANGRIGHDSPAGDVGIRQLP